MSNTVETADNQALESLSAKLNQWFGLAKSELENEAIAAEQATEMNTVEIAETEVAETAVAETEIAAIENLGDLAELALTPADIEQLEDVAEPAIAFADEDFTEFHQAESLNNAEPLTDAAIEMAIAAVQEAAIAATIEAKTETETEPETLSEAAVEEWLGDAIALESLPTVHEAVTEETVTEETVTAEEITAEATETAETTVIEAVTTEVVTTDAATTEEISPEAGIIAEPATPEDLATELAESVELEIAPEAIVEVVSEIELKIAPETESVANTAETIALEEVTQEKVAQVEIAQEEISQEELAQEELAQAAIPPQVSIQEVIAEEPIAEELATEELATEELATEETVAAALDTEEPVSEEPIAEELVSEELATEATMAEEIVPEAMVLEATPEIAAAAVVPETIAAAVEEEKEEAQGTEIAVVEAIADETPITVQEPVTEPPVTETPVTETPDAPLLTYNGPTELLIKTPILLQGTYNPQKVVKVTVTAEDKYDFTVVLDATAGSWKVELSDGFYQAGARWVRIEALDGGDRVLNSQVVNLIVSSNPLSVGKALKLTVLRPTFFKPTPTDSRSQRKNALVAVPAGESFTVQRYSYTDGHVLVELDRSFDGIGNTGYFYASHVELRKGQQILAFEIGQVPVIIPGACQVLITQETLLKQKPVDSIDLSEDQAFVLKQGQHFEITGYACIRGHFRVTLLQEIPGFGRTGYVFFDHAQIKRNEKLVEFDADALLLSVLEPTVFKKRPVNSSNLLDEQKCSLPQGQVYGVLAYEPAEDDHIAVTLSENLPGFGNTGYVHPSHVQLNRGAKVIEAIASQIELNVPYFCQRDNYFRPLSTCNVTALAMVMHYYGVQPRWGQLEDELYEWCVNNYGADAQTENVVLVRLAQAYGFKASFATNRTWSEVRAQLRKKQPVVLGGYFTAGGHILTVIGFNSEGYIVNDPWGDALTGYHSAYGRKLFYPKAYMEKMCSPEGDGHVWAHFIEPQG